MRKHSSLMALGTSILIIFVANNIESIDRNLRYARSLLLYQMSWSVSKVEEKVTSQGVNGSISAFEPRAEFSSTTYDGSIYIIGGANGDKFYNDVWKLNYFKPNTWDLVTAGGRKAKHIFSPRYSHQAVLFKDEIYVMGGVTNEPTAQILCDVWKIQDGGRSWKRLTADAWNKRGRIEFGAISYNNNMFVMGGFGGKPNVKEKTEMNDIYRSSDGILWKRVGNSTTAISRWARRRGFGVTTMENNVYLIGGYLSQGVKFFNDIWVSSDGGCEVWNQVTPISKTFFDPIADFKLLSFDSMLWVVGGMKDNNIYSNEVWSGEATGKGWLKMDQKTSVWDGRMQHGAAVCNGYLFVIGGVKGKGSSQQYLSSTSSYTNTEVADVWTSFVSEKTCNTFLRNTISSSCYCHNATSTVNAIGRQAILDLPLWLVVLLIVLFVGAVGVAIFAYRKWREKEKKKRLAKIKKMGGKAGMDVTKNLDVFLAKRVDNAKTPYGTKGVTKNLNAK